MAFRLPSGLPGTITWQAKQVGVSPYMLAMSRYSAPGHLGKQARFYTGLTMHHRMRSMAKAAAASPKAPSA